MRVEIWSDVVCPWCYIGKRRFERALATLERDNEIDVVWRSFQLNPELPVGYRQSHDDYLAARMRATPEQVATMNERVVALAADEGLRYRFDLYQVINTFDAHRVAHLGQAKGLGREIQERLLSAQLEEGEVLDDHETLVRLASEVGIPAGEARSVLASDAYAADVRRDIEEAHALGITGVPFFVVDRRYGVSGAQPTEVFVRVLEMAREAESAPAS